MSISALLKDPEALEKDLQAFASSKEAVEGGMSGLAFGNGLMTAVIVGPEPVPQTEWLPLLLDSPDSTLDGDDAQLLTGILLLEYGNIIKSLRSRSKPYKPFFWKDDEGRFIARDWAEGFHCRHALTGGCLGATLQGRCAGVFGYARRSSSGRYN